MSRRRISLVIPTCNRKNTLLLCLAAATNQDYPDYEVIVVDDGSTDSTGEMVQREFPQVRYLRQEPNRGPAAARNRGIEIATGEVVAFTDDDCLLPPDFLSRLMDGYRRYPEVAGVGGYLEASKEVLQRNPFARYEAYVTHRVYRAGPEEYLGGFECPAGGTNSMSYCRRVLREVGGFDESFPYAAGEDADLKHFWRQNRRHGQGAIYFERKYRGRPPSTARLALRLAARIARWFPDMVRLNPEIAAVKLLAELADWVGQWEEARTGHREKGK